MPVIAMTREMGSKGRDVALALAEDLGLDLMQHQLVEHIADKMHMREAAVNRLLEGKSGMFERWGVNEDNLSLYTTEEILEVAMKGNVLIRGWGATYVLRSVPHVLCVRVCASRENRARVVMERIGLEDEDLAMKEIERNDAAHTRTMHTLFHLDWRDPLLYDLVLNTDRLSVSACSSIIKHTLTDEMFQETPESRALLEHKVLEARVRSALRNDSRTARPSPSFEVKVDKETSQVILTGVVFDREFKKAAHDIALEVPGVQSVDDQMFLISYYGGP